MLVVISTFRRCKQLCLANWKTTRSWETCSKLVYCDYMAAYKSVFYVVYGWNTTRHMVNAHVISHHTPCIISLI